MNESQLDPVVVDILHRLVRHRGEAEAESLILDALKYAEVPVRETYSAQELFTISDSLVSHGGLIELIGRTLRMTALMKGAKLKTTTKH